MGEPDSRGRRSPEPIRVLKKFYQRCSFASVRFPSSPADWFGSVNINLDGSGRVVAPEQQEFKFRLQTQNLCWW